MSETDDVQDDWQPIDRSTCVHHTDRVTEFICTGCEDVFCRECVTEKMVNRHTFHFCQKCGCRCETYDPAERYEFLTDSTSSSDSFFNALLESCKYALNPRGAGVVVGGAVFLLVMGTLSMVPIIGFIFSLFVTLYVTAFIPQLIKSSADGENDMPGWPDTTHFSDDIVQPALQILIVTAASLAPALIYRYYFMESSGGVDGIYLGLFGIGLFFLPMNLLSVTLNDSMAGLNPVFVILSIARVWKDYLLLAMISLGIGGLIHFNVFVYQIHFIGIFLGNVVSLYLLLIEMRMIGLLYYHNRLSLRWFSESTSR